MNEADLVRHFPRLWHMAEDGSFESIRTHGLLSTSSLLDLYGIGGKERIALVSNRRPELVIISREGFPNAIVRDQKPMTESALKKCLAKDVTPSNGSRSLTNEPSSGCLGSGCGLLGARAYRGRPQTVLTVDTTSLLNA